MRMVQCGRSFRLLEKAEQFLFMGLQAFTMNGGIFRTTDSGASWAAVNSSTWHNAPIDAFAPFGPNIFAAVFDHGVYLSTDNGNSWLQKNEGLSGGINALSIAASPDPNGYVFTGISWGGAWKRPISQMITPTITATAGSHGTISPSGTMVVPLGTNSSFTVRPDAQYHTDSVVVDGVKVDSTTGYTFHNVVSNHTIRAVFLNDTFQISAIAGPNGTITPSGTVNVACGTNRQFVIAPLTGCHVDSVTVDREKVDSISSYTFSNVRAPHTIEAWFKINGYTTTSTAGPNGSIFPSGSTYVYWGANQQFTIEPSPGYHVDSVIVDGVNVDSTASYTFIDDTCNHTIRATFAPNIVTIVKVGFTLSSRWNLISLPVSLIDDSVQSVYPMAVSGAFAYSRGYQIRYRLANGTGYWIKFSAEQNDTLTGAPITQDTVNVSSGWNLVGSLSSPIPVASIQSIPAGMVTSSFFGYQGSYKTVDTIQPGIGYWVRVATDGKLVLSSGSPFTPRIAGLTAGIRIVATSEIPPPPPDGEISTNESHLPVVFALEQNYPNPFNPSTSISYSLPKESFVCLKVFDVLGRGVATLVNETKRAGYFTVPWNVTTTPSSIYFYRLEAVDLTEPTNSFVQVRKMLLMK